MSDRLREVILAAIRPGEARPVQTLTALSSLVPCDPNKVVALLWDMVEDGEMAYSADAQFRRLR